MNNTTLMTQNIGFICKSALFSVAVTFDFIVLLSIVFCITWLCIKCLSSILYKKTCKLGLTFPIILLCSVFCVLTPLSHLCAFLFEKLLSVFTYEQDISLLVSIASVLWAGFALLKFTRHLYRRTILGMLINQSENISGYDVFERAREATGTTIHIILKITEIKEVASFGVFKKYILLPNKFEDTYSQDEQYLLFLHEITHIKNGDTVKCFILEILKCVFWFHRLVLYEINKYMGDLEIMCDSSVIKTCKIDPYKYGELLLKETKMQNNIAVGFKSNHENTRLRFESLFENNFYPIYNKRIAVLLLILIAVYVFGFYLVIPKNNQSTNIVFVNLVDGKQQIVPLNELMSHTENSRDALHTEINNAISRKFTYGIVDSIYLGTINFYMEGVFQTYSNIELEAVRE